MLRHNVSTGGADGGVEGELMQQQLETGTEPCDTADQLLVELRRWRDRADGHAREVSCRIAALATSPVPAVPRTTPGERYHAIAEEFGITQAEQLACGMHVHVSTESHDWRAGVAAPDVSPITVSLMTFRAGRSGLAGELIHPLTRRPASPCRR